MGPGFWQGGMGNQDSQGDQGGFGQGGQGGMGQDDSGQGNNFMRPNFGQGTGDNNNNGGQGNFMPSGGSSDFDDIGRKGK